MIGKEGCNGNQNPEQARQEISRITGLSRNTIRNLLRSAAEPAKERAPRAGKLDTLESFLGEGMKAALPHRLPATVLRWEIKALDFTWQ